MKELFYCTKPEILKWLVNKGFNPIGTMPAAPRGLYSCLTFERTQELEKELLTYQKYIFNG